MTPQVFRGRPVRSIARAVVGVLMESAPNNRFLFGRRWLFRAGLIAALIRPALAGAAEVREIRADPFIAFILPVGNEDRIVVRRFGPRDLAELSLLSQDGQQGAHVESIAWSPDRKFLVFSTSSSGGHSPWNHRTYVFSTERWAFQCLDEAVAPVTSTEFSFPDATHLEVEALPAPSAEVDETSRRVIDLEKLPWVPTPDDKQS